MASVWMVHGECGEYSDMEYDVMGVFSSYEKAVAFVQSHAMTAYHHVGEVVLNERTNTVLHADNWGLSKSRYEDTYRGCESTVELVDTVEIAPTTTDGGTFAFVYPDGQQIDSRWSVWTYYVTEYEVDARCRANE